MGGGGGGGELLPSTHHLEVEIGFETVGWGGCCKRYINGYNLFVMYCKVSVSLYQVILCTEFA